MTFLTDAIKAAMKNVQKLPDDSDIKDYVQKYLKENYHLIINRSENK